MHIEPQTTLPILYQLVDPLDSTLYYVRAVVYNSTTGAVITSSNLVSQGNGLYKNTITAPADPLGTGLHIHVIINVYTDSGYTTNSENYQRQIDKYIVKSSLKFGGGGSGPDFDYEKMLKLISAVIAQAVQSITLSIKSHATDLKPVLQRIMALQKIVKEIEMPEFEQEATDLSPVLDRLATLEKGIIKAIDQKEVTPEAQPTDISPIIEALSTIQEALKNMHGMTESSKMDMMQALDSVKTEMTKAREDKKQTMRDVMAEMFTGIQEPVTKKPSSMDKYFVKK